MNEGFNYGSIGESPLASEGESTQVFSFRYIPLRNATAVQVHRNFSNMQTVDIKVQDSTLVIYTVLEYYYSRPFNGKRTDECTRLACPLTTTARIGWDYLSAMGLSQLVKPLVKTFVQKESLKICSRRSKMSGKEPAELSVIKGWEMVKLAEVCHVDFAAYIRAFLVSGY